jgi:hypothetical protein
VQEQADPQGGGWIFGRKGQGYVALYSHLPYEWQAAGPDAGQEIVAVGRRNVWICQCGRQAVDGSFAEFVRAVSSASMAVTELEVAYEAPGVGLIQFNWSGALTVNAAEVPLRDYPRWSNPFCSAEFDSRQFTITCAGRILQLDFENNQRTIG